MKRLLIFPVAVMLILCACRAEAEKAFVDDTGEEIRLHEKPSCTAVLFSSFAEIWTLSGGEFSVTVYETIERGFAPEGTKLVDSGAGKHIDVEALVMSGADFIIGSADIPSHEKAREQMRNAGVPFALFHVESLEDYLRVFGIMTEINENESAYRMYGESVFSEAIEIIENAQIYRDEDPQTILFIRSGSGYSSAKAKTAEMHFAAKMLEELGAKNIADDVPVIIDGLSFEEIYEKDPNAIFISLMGDEDAARTYMQTLLSGERWQALSAVQSGRCYFLSKDLFQYKPNARWAEAYRQMAEMLYPEWSDE